MELGHDLQKGQVGAEMDVILQTDVRKEPTPQQHMRHTGWLYFDFLYQSLALRTILVLETLADDFLLGKVVTHKSSLIVDGLPNCVAVERSRLKQIIQTRVLFKISLSCLSEVTLVEGTW